MIFLGVDSSHSIGKERKGKRMKRRLGKEIWFKLLGLVLNRQRISTISTKRTELRATPERGREKRRERERERER